MLFVSLAPYRISLPLLRSGIPRFSSNEPKQLAVDTDTVILNTQHQIETSIQNAFKATPTIPPTGQQLAMNPYLYDTVSQWADQVLSIQNNAQFSKTHQIVALRILKGYIEFEKARTLANLAKIMQSTSVPLTRNTIIIKDSKVTVTNNPLQKMAEQATAFSKAAEASFQQALSGTPAKWLLQNKLSLLNRFNHTVAANWNALNAPLTYFRRHEFEKRNIENTFEKILIFLRDEYRIGIDNPSKIAHGLRSELSLSKKQIAIFLNGFGIMSQRIAGSPSQAEAFFETAKKWAKEHSQDTVLQNEIGKELLLIPPSLD